MNLKLKRLVRTPASEQYALFDLDQLDGSGQPATIGKLDLHYTNEGMYGTLLLWDESIRAMAAGVRRTFVRALLADLAQPMGVPNEFVVEFFAPSLDLYDVIHNVGLDDDEDETDPVDESPDVLEAAADASDEDELGDDEEPIDSDALDSDDLDLDDLAEDEMAAQE